MSRKTLVTLLLIIASALLAVALFVAGAIWRGRVTGRSSGDRLKKTHGTRQTCYVSSRAIGRSNKPRVERVGLTWSRSTLSVDDCARISGKL
jgi:hypothetical protein